MVTISYIYDTYGYHGNALETYKIEKGMYCHGKYFIIEYATKSIIQISHHYDWSNHIIPAQLLLELQLFP